jgi:hypothetical protein
MNQIDADQIALRVYDDVVRRWLPVMDIAMLGEVIADLGEGPGALWGVLRADLTPRRDLLRLDVLAAAERLLGYSWLIEDDALLTIPDTPSCLLDDDSKR